MTKKVSFGAKPQGTGKTLDADTWVSGTTQGELPKAEAEPMKRLTIDVPASLHRRIKVQCAAREVKIADEVRKLLDKHFPETSEQEAS